MTNYVSRISVLLLATVALLILSGGLYLSSTKKPQETASSWKTFRDNRFQFEFKYPSNWSYEIPVSGPRSGQIELKNEKKELAISIGSYDPRVVGISYCEASPEDERCEALVTEGGMAITIDWNVNGKANALVDGINVTLERVNSNTKQFFRQILSTFRFLEEDGLVECILNNCGKSCVEMSEDNPISNTLCVVDEEIECYRKAVCEKQNDGKCGWSQTEELTTCLTQYLN